MSRVCGKCGSLLADGEFYRSRNLEKYPDGGLMNLCKKCMTMHVDNWEPDTYLWILEEADVPYIKEQWDKLLERYGTDPKKITGMTIMGRYLSKMRIKPWSEYHWADSDRIEQETRDKKIESLRSQGYDADEIEEILSIDKSPKAPEGYNPANLVDSSADSLPIVVTEEDIKEQELEDSFLNQLTDEDKIMLRLKWGKEYTPEEWVRLEQLYNDMMSSYDIQGAGHKDTLILVCKTSLKANELIDAGDLDGYQKISKVYDSLMKSGKFTAAQNKGESGEFVDCIGELVTLCETEGFIPRYYTDGPQDKVDRTLQDLQQYTHTLVTEELNLGDMIESSLKEITKDREREARIDVADGDDEDDLFDYDANLAEMTEEDYAEFNKLVNGEEDDE